MGKVSLQTIADSLGVSRATVSLALNGKTENRRVSEEMVQKIVRKAKELDYQPNELARSLRVGKTKTIGIIVSDISNVFFAKFIYEIQERARMYDYAVLTTNMEENASRFSEMANLLANRIVDGIIAVPTDGSLDAIRGLVEKNIPVVQIDRRLKELNVSSVVLDNWGASYKVAECLAMQGCRRVALVGHCNDTVNVERSGGFMDGVRKFGLHTDDSIIYTINYHSEEDDVRKSMRDLSERKNDVDAVFFLSHELLITGARCLYKEGVSIPGDMKVASFDNLEVFSLLDFPIICVDQPIRAMAEKAVDILMGHIWGDKEVKHSVFDGNICFC